MPGLFIDQPGLDPPCSVKSRVTSCRMWFFTTHRQSWLLRHQQKDLAFASAQPWVGDQCWVNPRQRYCLCHSLDPHRFFSHVHLLYGSPAPYLWYLWKAALSSAFNTAVTAVWPFSTYSSSPWYIQEALGKDVHMLNCILCFLTLLVPSASSNWSLEIFCVNGIGCNATFLKFVYCTYFCNSL